MFSQDIINIINKATQEFNEKKELFNDIENKPKLILTKLYNNKLNNPYYELFFKMFSREDEYNYHEVQQQLFNIIKPYLESLDNEITVELDSPSRYTSTCSINYLNEKIITFDFYKHQYKTYKTPTYYKFIRINTKSLDEDEESLQFYTERKDNIFKWLINDKSLRGYLHIPINFITIITRRKFIKEFTDKQVLNIEQRINDHKERIKRDAKLIKEKRDFEILIQPKLEFWEQVFTKQFNYEKKEYL